MFVKILENEIWILGRNLPLATFGSERVMDFCGTLITAGRCEKIRHRLRSQPERDRFFAALNYFSWIFPYKEKYFALKSHSILVILEGSKRLSH